MKLKDVAEFVVGNQYILFIPDNRRAYSIYANTIRDELPCTAYENYLYFANCEVETIRAKSKDLIEITIKEGE